MATNRGLKTAERDRLAVLEAGGARPRRWGRRALFEGSEGSFLLPSGFCLLPAMVGVLGLSTRPSYICLRLRVWPSSRRACLSVCLSELPSLARASVVGLGPTLLCSGLVLTRSYPQRPYFPITFLRRYRGSGSDKFFRGTQLNSWQSGFLLITLSNAVSRLKKKWLERMSPEFPRPSRPFLVDRRKSQRFEPFHESTKKRSF